MPDSPDSLEALARATSKKSAAAQRQHAERLKAQRRRRLRVRLVGAVLILALGAVAAVLVIKLRPPPEPPPPPPVVKVNEPPPGQVERMSEVERDWEALKTHEITPAFKPLFETGNAQAQSMRSTWRSGQYIQAAAAMQKLDETIKSIQTLDRLREAALQSRHAAAAMAQETQKHKPQELVPTLWSQAKAEEESAGRNFDADDFSAASEGWRSASEAYGRAAVAADKAKAAGEARRNFQARLVKRFDAATLSAQAAPALEKVNAVLGAGDKDYAELRFDEALKKFQQAQEMVPAVELAVQQQIGAHYYALLAGYRAADLLLVKASGDKPGEAQWKAFRSELENLLLPPESIKTLNSAGDGDYSALARLLMDGTAKALTSRWGGPIGSSFEIGVQVRLIEQMLNSDADTFARQEASEIRKSIAIVQRESQAAQYPSGLQEVLKSLLEKLAIKPEYKAIRQSQKLWTDLVRRFDKFDEAIKLLPRTGR